MYSEISHLDIIHLIILEFSIFRYLGSPNQQINRKSRNNHSRNLDIYNGCMYLFYLKMCVGRLQCELKMSLAVPNHNPIAIKFLVFGRLY